MAKKKKSAGKIPRKAARRGASAKGARAPARSAKPRSRSKSAPTKKKTAHKAVAKARKRLAKPPVRRKSARRPAVRARQKAPRSSAAEPEKGSADYRVFPPPSDRGLGLEAGGQSGDLEGLSRVEEAASESVEELVEEGQAFEAGVVSGVENAADADVAEVVTREVPEDDVPEEYLEKE